MKSLEIIFKDVPEAKILGNAKICPKVLITDSRRVIPGALFFAIDGLNREGALFASDAVARGAVAVVSKKKLALPDRIAQVIVPSVSHSLALAAGAFYDNPHKNLKLVGVTGTNGKTSIASIVRFLMMRQSDGREPWGLLGTVRYELGTRSLPSYKTTPESLDIIGFLAEMRHAGCKGAVMEVSSHAIAQNRVYGLPFDIVAFTNLTRDHMDYHGDMENYFSVKRRLFDGAQGTFPRVAVVNADDSYGRRLLADVKPNVRCLAFGINPKNLIGFSENFTADEIVSDASGSRFKLHCPSGTISVKTSLPGDYNISNALCALAIVYALGGNVVRAAADLCDFSGVPGRMERVSENPFPFDVFVDYAHTDDALTNALGMLRKVARGRVLVVFGCGGNRDRGKRPKMVRAVQSLADFAWVTSDNPRKEPLERIFDDMREGVSAAEKIVFEADRRRAIGMALDAAQDGDVVLIAGKGHETYQEFADVTLPFDDREVAQELLELRSRRLSR